MEEELDKLLSKPVSYYRALILKDNRKFDFKKPVILFGAGDLGEELISFFKNKGTEVVAFSDNDSHKIGKFHCGTKVINRKQIPVLYGHNIQIVASCTKYEEVLKDLRKAGFINSWSPMYFFTLYSSAFDLLVWKNNINLILSNRNKIKLVYKQFKENESKKELSRSRGMMK